MKTVYGSTSTQQTTQRALLNERSVLVYVLGPTRAQPVSSETLPRAPLSGEVCPSQCALAFAQNETTIVYWVDAANTGPRRLKTALER